MKFFRYVISKIWNRQLLVFLFFVLLSSAFWLFQALNEEQEQDIEVPYKLVNVPENVVITTDLPPSIRLHVRDRAFILMQYILKTRRVPDISIDFTEYQNNSGHVRILTAELIKQVSGKFESSMTLLGTRPDTLEFFYNYGDSKRVPVRWQGDIQTADEYSLSEIKLAKDSVTVYASRQILDTITAAWLQPVYLKNIIDTTDITCRMQKIRGARFTPNEVRMLIIADRMIENTVQVPIEGINFPPDKHLRTFPAQASITYQAGMRVYKNISADNFILVLNYEDLLKSSDNRARIALKSVPEGVSHVRLNPQEVEFVIEDGE